MSEVLQAAHFPLWGSRLIEASAGTGKTWTIAALYLRLVLGHGGDAAFARPMTPAEVLVMTFTRAATRELSDRIRSRLLEAARCFRGEASPHPADTFLAELLTAYAGGLPRKQAAWRLTLAAESMDDAAVHTIDAWCQRMLREHAFDSGCLFDEELAANERAMQFEAARDYWRQQLYPLPAAALDEALAVWPGVEALAADTQALLEVELPAATGQGSLRDCIESACDQRAAALARLKQGWAGRAQAMQAWLDGAYDGKDFPFDRRKLARNHYNGWLAALAGWAEKPGAERPELTTTAVARLKPEGMHAALKPGAQVDLPPHFDAFAQLMHDLDAVPVPASALRLHAAARVQQRLAELKQQAGSFGFADMLGRLDRALDPAHNGAAAERLRARILAQTPVALVDEFQDTSPLQASILDRLYRVADNGRETALLLIGDPKQSIYGFRGADIHSYLGMRRATAGRHYVLGTNHRSTAGLVSAVNHVFEQAQARPGEGAFLYRTEADAMAADDPVPFVPVRARGRGEVFVTSAGAADPVTLVLDAELQAPREHLRTNGRRCAERIVALLNDPGAGFQGPESAWARLRPADVAVLVRTGREATAVRQALRQRGVASVYLSDKESVLRSVEAQDLLLVLRAVAAPLHARLVRAALATRLLGLSLAELAQLADDDEAFDQRTEQFRQLHAVWQGQGVLAMLRQALHRLDLPARWLAVAQAPGDQVRGPGEGAGESERGGERRLTNVLHLAELLQAASARLRGEQALIRWLAEQMQGEGAGGDEQIVRLESDADLVQVITVHKAKGLEYPLVFLPYACTFRPVDKSRTRFLNVAGAEGVRTLHLQLTDELLAAADKDRLREDLRLLYVALTRARHALWLGVTALTAGRSRECSAHRSAFGCLVGGGMPTDAAGLAAQVQALAQAGSGIVVEAAQAPGHTPLQPRAALPPLRAPAAYAASFERHWSIGSFTALVRALPGPVSAVAARDDEGPAPADAAEFGMPEAGAAAPSLVRHGRTADGAPWHAFPRGAVPGNFLHGVLEWLAGEGFARVGSPAVREQLQRRCEQQGQGRYAAAVQTWLAALVATDLPPLGTALSGLERLLPEMEFWFPGDGLDAGQVDALCRAHLLDGVARPPLPGRELRGMLTGFADLVFEYGGRWWVLDYKSNALGPGDADYTPQALRAAMAEHRYDVQAALYLLALHRLLRQRLGAGYDPARQLGGALYFFIRGIRGPARGCLHVPASLPLLAALEALLQRGAAVAR
ncbi:MAG: exodeoxyribonuclease V subunit beta [Betaproteobacteria bacterium]|nr:exodeoxyribonuclease V subunit beta [Betaproteobacteria bacterium]